MYTQAVLKKFGLEHCTPAVAQGTKLLKAMELFDANSQLVCYCISQDGQDQT